MMDNLTRTPWNKGGIISFLVKRGSGYIKIDCYSVYLTPMRCVHAKSLHLCLTLFDPMDSSLKAPLSMGFSRQELWGGLPCPPPENLSKRCQELNITSG